MDKSICVEENQKIKVPRIMFTFNLLISPRRKSYYQWFKNIEIASAWGHYSLRRHIWIFIECVSKRVSCKVGWQDIFLPLGNEALHSLCDSGCVSIILLSVLHMGILRILLLKGTDGLVNALEFPMTQFSIFQSMGGYCLWIRWTPFYKIWVVNCFPDSQSVIKLLQGRRKKAHFIK